MCDQKLSAASASASTASTPASVAVTTGAARSVSQLRAFWEQLTTRKLDVAAGAGAATAAAIAIALAAAVASVDSETELDTDGASDSASDSDSDGNITADDVDNDSVLTINNTTTATATATATACACADAEGDAHVVVCLPNFEFVAVFFLAAFTNWLAILAMEVLPPAVVALLNVALPILAGTFSRLGAPALTATSRAPAPITSAVGPPLLWAVCLMSHWFAASETDAVRTRATPASAAGDSNSGDGTDNSAATATASGFTENYDHATYKICALLFSSQCGDVQQRARVNLTRDMLHDMDLQFEELDVATTIDVREILAMKRLIETSKLRGTFPQVFTVEIGTAKPVADRIRYITPAQLREAEFFFGTPATELARRHLLGASVHGLFSGVRKRKCPNAFAEEVLALPAGVLVTRPAARALFKHWRAPDGSNVAKLAKAQAKAKAREPLESEAAWVKRRACLFQETVPLEMMLI